VNQGEARHSLALPGRQDELVRRVATASPGQEITVELPVPARTLAHWDTTSPAWTVEPGIFHLTVGRSYGDQRLTTGTAVAAAVQDRS
jgi:Fibronectin type III-like domain